MVSHTAVSHTVVSHTVVSSGQSYSGQSHSGQLHSGQLGSELLEEFRRVRAEQDLAYEESLLIDRQKVFL